MTDLTGYHPVIDRDIAELFTRNSGSTQVSTSGRVHSRRDCDRTALSSEASH